MHFDAKFYFFIFCFFFMGGEREELLDSYGERENSLLMTFLPLNRLKFVSTGSIRWEESYNDYFKSPCIKEKKNKSRSSMKYFFSVWFIGLDRYLILMGCDVGFLVL